MNSHSTLWDGNEWQEYVDRLLALRYGLDYQRVPAKHKGDLGLDGFSCRDAAAFQCYAAQEPLSTQELYEKQRDKMTDDLHKFASNKPELQQLLQHTKIRLWVLVVPRFESVQLVLHASQKTTEIRALTLAYVSDDFEVKVVTDAHFDVERETLRRSVLARLPVPAQPVSSEAAVEWAVANVSLVETFDGKAATLGTLNASQRAEFRNRMLIHYLECENDLQFLKISHAYWYEKIVKLKESRERFLATQSLIKNQDLDEVIRSFITELQDQVKAIDASTAERIGYGTASDWMLRCPLSFPEVGDA